MERSFSGAGEAGRALPHQHSEAYSVPENLAPRRRQVRAQAWGVWVLEVPAEMGRAREVGWSG